MNRDHKRINIAHVTYISGAEVEERLKGILKAAGVEMLITDARVSALFPDGAVAHYQPVDLDTEAEGC